MGVTTEINVASLAFWQWAGGARRGSLNAFTTAKLTSFLFKDILPETWGGGGEGGGCCFFFLGGGC